MHELYGTWHLDKAGTEKRKRNQCANIATTILKA